MSPTLLAILFPLVFAVLAVLFLVGLVVVGRLRGVEEARPPAPFASRGSVPEAGAAGRWNAEILGAGVMGAAGSTLTSTFGVFEVCDATLTFTPDGADAVGWTTPCRTLGVTGRGLMSLDGADVSLTWPTGPGAWHTVSCNVSGERINKVMGNDFKDVRERRYAAEFIACLGANGARVNS